MNKSRLTPLEWEIINVVWEIHDRITVRDVLSRAYPNDEKAYTTVQTIMNKLEEKGFLTKKKIGMVNFYQAAVKKEDVVKKETTNFINKVYRGSVKALVNQLVDSDSLTLDEISELRSIIEKKERSKK